jgi:hypothetical protein
MAGSCSAPNKLVFLTLDAGCPRFAAGIWPIHLKFQENVAGGGGNYGGPAILDKLLIFQELFLCRKR